MDGSPTAVEKLIAEQVTLTGSSSTATIDVTSKDNAGYSEFLAGLQENEFSFEAVVDFDVKNDATKLGYLDLQTFKNSRAIKTFKAKINSASGTTYSYQFNALITKLDVTANMEDKISCSVSLKQSGAPTITNA